MCEVHDQEVILTTELTHFFLVLAHLVCQLSIPENRAAECAMMMTCIFGIHKDLPVSRTDEINRSFGVLSNRYTIFIAP